MKIPIRTAVIGCGGMARYHIAQMLQQPDTTEIVVLSEPSPEQVALTARVFSAANKPIPPNQPDIQRMLHEYALDAAFIVTPHVYHYPQAVACMQAGLDVLLEKPMVMNAAEAEALIELRNHTGRLLVVAFPGSLSPRIRRAVQLLRSGELGRLLSIDAVAWQNWGAGTANTWRQNPAMSGGGFLFDTGAHMLNTVVDLAGEPFVEVSAWLDKCGRPVETISVAIAHLASGGYVTLHGNGEAIPSCASTIRVFTSEAILTTGIWGETLKLQRSGRRTARLVPTSPSLGVWQQFVQVRQGVIENPCPPEVGLRMAKLYDAIMRSAAQGGCPVAC
ncbi:MAG: Gfo/Idh/MocA family oxidoreductase [Anaerolineaceae bacterium]|jgi:predicted dehydrogenase